jgi:hypothetical protein
MAVVALLVSGLVGACAQGASSSEQSPDPVGTAQSGTDPTPTATSTATPAPTPTNPPAGNSDGNAKSPTLASISPSSATVGSVGPTIVLAGQNFVARTVVQLDGAPLTTTFVSDTELRATIPSSSLTKVGMFHVSVGTSPPGGGASAALEFTVENPAPAITTLAPLGVVAGAADTTVTIGGDGFVAGAVVTVQGNAVKSTLVDAKTITAIIPATMLLSSGTLDVVVQNPMPGGGTAAPLAFTVSNPAVQLTAITPTTALVNAAATTVTLNGSGFVTASSALFNGSPVSTTYVDGRTLKAVIPQSALTAVGDFPVAVKNPPPGGGVSMPLTFRVQYGVPQITTVAPTTVTAGAGATSVTVSGSSFYAASQVLFNGAASATTFVSGSQLTATLTAAQVATAGPISVSVITPAPGGGTSNMASITVQNPAPVITTLAPASLTMGSPDTLLTLTGTGFVPSSVLQVNAGNLPTTYVSATQLKATIPAALMASPGALSITVFTAAPGGGTSAAKSLPIGCNTAGVDVALGAVGNVTTLSTNFAAAPLYTRMIGGLCSVTLDAATQPGRYYVVQNTAGVPVTLSAWAVCPDASAQDDAVMTFYHQGSAPADDASRKQCWDIASEGDYGAAGTYPSPESGTSHWCPGLTKANGGGIGLAACDRAVVFIQPYSMTSASYLPPPQIRFKAE